MPREENSGLEVPLQCRNIWLKDQSHLSASFIKRAKLFPRAAPTELEGKQKSGKMSFLPCILSFTNSFCVGQTRIPQATEGPECVLSLM